ncbi:MAG TPA: glycosyltransferase [Vicinamibacterales bacterium]|nr:glycosyltransferase [Vicinamibacterales bacterium]
MASPPAAGGSPIPVSFVVPVRNGERWIRDVIEGIALQRDGRPMEIIVVDDGSEDRTTAILRELAVPDLRVIAGYGRGAAAAVNTGIRAARFPIICQVDQDVLLRAGWLEPLVSALDDPTVAAAQGCYVSDRTADLSARVMGFDLEQRYDALQNGRTTHVCTGNSVYRAEAFQRAGLFDEQLGYGYDNDMSYRLQQAGYRLVFRREAQSTHRWREGLWGYCVQQYGFGYGRLDLVARYPRRLTGDSVSPLQMMLHPVVMTIALLALAAAAVLAAASGPARYVLLLAAGLLCVLFVERAIAGARAARRFRSTTPLLFPLFHLARDAAWVAAIATWTARRITGRGSHPAHSMTTRPADRGHAGPRGSRSTARAQTTPRALTRVLGLIPAHNEAATLQGVVADVRASHPALDLLVIDDGSTDDTPDVVEELGVRWLRLPERMGIGSAMRAGLRYAARQGYHIAVRLDGDGQHRASDIQLILAPILDGRADVVLGSRYTASDANTSLSVRLVQRLLSLCLRALTGRVVTDPTSGFCALGPRAVRLLAEHHPTGYPEPELQLFLDRNGLRVVEVPVLARSRQGGRTSLTPFRLTAAGARVLLAMIIVPFRSGVGRVERD